MPLLPLLFMAAPTIVVGLKSKNPTKTIACLGVTAVACAAFTVAAPAIATTLGALGVLGATSSGTLISTLKGAALTKAALATLGGGSIAAGGAGIAGGVTTIATAGTCMSATAAALATTATPQTLAMELTPSESQQI